MDILIGLVVAMFIITAAFVGYHASQEPAEVGGHDIGMGLEIMSQSSKAGQVIEHHDTYKNIV